MNPIRYRGYYYDTETKLYYLQSRHYNSEWGRFISADVYADTGDGILGTNMYAYCQGDPVNAVDPSGMAPIGVLWKQGLFGVRHPIIASSVGSVTAESDNISSRASRFALKTGLRNGDGSQINALRHTIWSASIARAWGANIANQVVSSHESKATLKAIDAAPFGPFSTLELADAACDVLNNEIGISIIAGNPANGNGGVVNIQQVALEALQYYFSQGLYVVQEQRNGSFTVVRQRINATELFLSILNIVNLDVNARGGILFAQN